MALAGWRAQGRSAASTWRRALLTGLLAASACATQVRYAPSATESAPPVASAATLFLVGDAGKATPGRDATLTHLQSEIETAAAGGTQVVVAYLGDNLYELGARESFVDLDFPLLEAQVAPLGRRSNVRGVFVPGNHDWGKGAAEPGARVALQLQTQWIDRLGEGRSVSLLPADGCPGPATLDVDPSVHLIFIDTEWLLREPTDDCGGTDGFYDRLESDLATNSDRRVVIMAHHPLATGGPHGGNVSLFDRGPFVFYLATKAGVSRQDLASIAYSRMIERLTATFLESENPPFVFAAGHDHNLQVIRGTNPAGPAYHLVSGAGAKTSPTRAVPGTRYATERNGYMRLDFQAENARLTVFAQASADGPVTAVFACTLSPSDTGACPEAPMLTGSR